MEARRNLLTLNLDGTRYRGAYSIEGQELIVEAHGLGRKSVDASIVDFRLGKPAHKLATLIFVQLVKAGLDRNDDTLELVIQGSTTQPTFTSLPL